MIRIIENQTRNDQVQMLTAETHMAKALWEIRSVARFFQRYAHFFKSPSLSFDTEPRGESS